MKEPTKTLPDLGHKATSLIGIVKRRRSVYERSEKSSKSESSSSSSPEETSIAENSRTGKENVSTKNVSMPSPRPLPSLLLSRFGHAAIDNSDSEIPSPRKEKAAKAEQLAAESEVKTSHKRTDVSTKSFTIFTPPAQAKSKGIDGTMSPGGRHAWSRGSFFGWFRSRPVAPVKVEEGKPANVEEKELSKVEAKEPAKIEKETKAQESSGSESSESTNPEPSIVEPKKDPNSPKIVSLPAQRPPPSMLPSRSGHVAADQSDSEVGSPTAEPANRFAYDARDRGVTRAETILKGPTIPSSASTAAKQGVLGVLPHISPRPRKVMEQIISPPSSATQQSISSPTGQAVYSPSSKEAANRATAPPHQAEQAHSPKATKLNPTARDEDEKHPHIVRSCEVGSDVHITTVEKETHEHLKTAARLEKASKARQLAAKPRSPSEVSKGSPKSADVLMKIPPAQSKTKEMSPVRRQLSRGSFFGLFRSHAHVKVEEKEPVKLKERNLSKVPCVPKVLQPAKSSMELAKIEELKKSQENSLQSPVANRKVDQSINPPHEVPGVPPVNAETGSNQFAGEKLQSGGDQLVFDPTTPDASTAKKETLSTIYENQLTERCDDRPAEPVPESVDKITSEEEEESDSEVVIRRRPLALIDMGTTTTLAERQKLLEIDNKQGWKARAVKDQREGIEEAKRISVLDRLKNLDASAEKWKERVPKEKDHKALTVEARIAEDVRFREKVAARKGEDTKRLLVQEHHKESCIPPEMKARIRTQRVKEQKASDDGRHKEKIVPKKSANGPEVARRLSVRERVQSLGASSERWKDRVNKDKDFKALTVEARIAKGIEPKETSHDGKASQTSRASAPPTSITASPPIPQGKLKVQGKPLLPLHVSLDREAFSESEETRGRGAEEADDEIFAEQRRNVASDYEKIESVTIDDRTKREEAMDAFFEVGKAADKPAAQIDKSAFDEIDSVSLLSPSFLSKKVNIPGRRKPLTKNVFKQPTEAPPTISALKTESSPKTRQTKSLYETLPGTQERLAQPIEPTDPVIRRSDGLAIDLDISVREALSMKEDFEDVKVKLRTGKTINDLAPGQKQEFVPYNNLMLLMIKGRRHVQVRIVEPSVNSLNHNDCFLLVQRDHLFLFVGEHANVVEKAKAKDFAGRVVKFRQLGCRAKEIIMIQPHGESDDQKKFYQLLGNANAKYSDIRASKSATEDEEYEAAVVSTNCVYLVRGSQLVTLDEGWGKILAHKICEHQDRAMVFDFGTEVYVWLGRSVTQAVRGRALRLGIKLFQMMPDYSNASFKPFSAGVKHRPDWCVFGKVNGRMETPLFQSKFIDWPESNTIIKEKTTKRNSQPVGFAPAVVSWDGQSFDERLETYDAAEMLKRPRKEHEAFFEHEPVGRGVTVHDPNDPLRNLFKITTVMVTKWVIRHDEPQKVPAHDMPVFHYACSYIVKWQYQISQAIVRKLTGGMSDRQALTGRDRFVYFIWQGRKAVQGDKITAALKAPDLNAEKAPILRVDDGCEPPVFLALFNGAMVVREGKPNEKATEKPQLFALRGCLSNEACLQETDCNADSLRQQSSYVVTSPSTGVMYIWHGSMSQPHTKQTVKAAAKSLKDRLDEDRRPHVYSIRELREGEEIAPLKKILHFDSKPFPKLRAPLPSNPSSLRVFYYSNTTGKFTARDLADLSFSTEVFCPFPITQTLLYELSQPTICLIHTPTEIWVWVGWMPERTSKICQESKEKDVARLQLQDLMDIAFPSAAEYAKLTKLPCLVVYAGLEPSHFIALFPKWKHHPDIATLNSATGHKAGTMVPLEEAASKLRQTFPIGQLRKRPLPDIVDPRKIEFYLDDRDFKAQFGMTKAEFYKLPEWKQTREKQHAGLF